LSVKEQQYATMDAIYSAYTITVEHSMFPLQQHSVLLENFKAVPAAQAVPSISGLNAGALQHLW